MTGALPGARQGLYFVKSPHRDWPWGSHERVSGSLLVGSIKPSALVQWGAGYKDLPVMVQVGQPIWHPTWYQKQASPTQLRSAPWLGSLPGSLYAFLGRGWVMEPCAEAPAMKLERKATFISENIKEDNEINV